MFDIFFGICGIFFGILVVFISNFYHLNQMHIGCTIIFSCLCYLLFVGWGASSCIKSELFSTIKQFIPILNVAFFILFILSVLSLKSEIYSRPIAYFIFISLLSVIVALQIISLDNKSHIWIVLLNIFLLSLNIRWGIYYLFPGLHGVDPWYHYALIRDILQFGYLPLAEVYSNWPIMHLVAVISKLLLDWEIKDSLFIISIIEIISLIFIFLLTRNIFDTKIALMATLILSISDHNILWGVDLTPMTLGYVFFVIILYLIIVSTNVNQQNLAKIYLLILIFMSVNILTHVISNFAIIVMLLSILILDIMRSFIYNIRNKYVISGKPVFPGRKIWQKKVITYNLFIYLVVITFEYWMYALRTTDNRGSFFESSLRAVINAIDIANVGHVELVTRVSDLSQWTTIENHLGYLIMLFFAIFGMLLTIRFGFYIDSRKDLLIIASAFFMLLLYGSALIGSNAILPQRWFLFLYSLISIMAAFGIFSICFIFNGRSQRIAFISTIILIMTFFMITDSLVNSESPIYPAESILNISYSRSWLYESELDAGDFAKYVQPGEKVMSDSYYAGRLFYWNGLKNSTSISLSDPKSYSNGLVILRKDILEGAFIERSTSFMFVFRNATKNFEDNFKKSSNFIYDNNIVKVYAPQFFVIKSL
jgi:hypothetical protein